MPRLLLIVLAVLALAACGAPAPAAPTRSAVEERQTAIALQGRPTLAALPTSAIPTVPPSPTPRPLAELLDIRADDPRSLGRADAPVVMVEFTDFECPFCQRFAEETRPELLRRYVDTGVLRIVARDFPVPQLHPSATLAATAARCAAGQGQFWPMYERLFATHSVSWGGLPDRDRATFIAMAGELGLDPAAFDACLNDPAVAADIQAEAAAAQELRINGTPTFFINGQMVVGAQPLDSFAALIEQAAAR